MADRVLRTVLEGGSYFEAPRWHDGGRRVSAFYRHTVGRVAPGGGETVVLEVQNQPWGLGWLPDGSLLVVSMKDHRLLRVSDGRYRHTPTRPAVAAERIDGGGRGVRSTPTSPSLGRDVQALAPSETRSLDVEALVAPLPCPGLVATGARARPDGGRRRSPGRG
jgi:hypothetical protein